MYDPTSNDFYANFIWYVKSEATLALEQGNNPRAQVVRELWDKLLPVSKTTESQVRDFNAACAAYREEAETVQMFTINS